MKAIQADSREATLPRWAQYIINDLRREVGSLRADLSSARGAAPADTRIIIEASHARHSIDFPLHDQSRIRFRVGKHERDYVSVYFDAAHDGALTLNGGDSLIAQPWSSNVLLLTTARIHDVIAAQEKVR